MAEYAHLKSMFDAALLQAGEESSMLLGQTLQVGESDVINTNRMTYFSDMDNAIFVVGVESREEYPGRFYMIFSLADAIVMSGTLLGIPPARISEKRRLCIFEADDGDAFGEIANQIIGSFNSVLQPQLPNKVHLKQLAPNKYIPEVDQLTDEEPLPEGDYLMLRSQLEIKGLEMKCLDIMIPTALANLFDPQPVVVEAAASGEEAFVADSAEAAGAGDQEHEQLRESILILGEDPQDRQSVVSYLATTGLKLIDAPLNANLQELFEQGAVKVAVINLKETGDRDLVLGNKVSSQSRKSSFPIIMCSDHWTRTTVLKAIKNGATDIIMRPFDGDELVRKVSKFLKAA
jgi:DNA-binding NarL/FixJ family response regulator